MTGSSEREALSDFMGGATGVELAGALAEIARHTLRKDFRHIDPTQARVLLVEAGPRVLAVYPESLSEKAIASLARLGVHAMVDTRLKEIRNRSVVLESKGTLEEVPARTVLWAAGVRASPLARKLSESSGAALDRAGRVDVQPDLTLLGHPEVFVLGDMARCVDAQGVALPGLAPVAMQQGRYAAKVIERRLRGQAATAPFVYHGHGSMATIGRSSAVAVIGKRRFSGFLAWCMWLFVHLLQLAQFENRLLVLLQWSWSYLTFHRSARLITGQHDLDLREVDGEPPALADGREERC